MPDCPERRRRRYLLVVVIAFPSHSEAECRNHFRVLVEFHRNGTPGHCIADSLDLVRPLGERELIGFGIALGSNDRPGRICHGEVAVLV